MKSVFLLLLVFNLAQAASFKFCYEEWEPYASGTPAKGTTLDILKKVATDLGHTFEFIQINASSRCQKEVVDGKIDGMLFGSTEAESGMIYSAIPTEYWIIAVITGEASTHTSFTDFNAFKGKSFGKVSGYEYPEDVSKHFPMFKMDEVPEADTNLKKIAAGRVDFTADDPIWAQLAAKRLGIKLKVLEPTVTYDPTRLAMNKKHKDVLAAIDAKLKEHLDKGVFDQIYKEHTGKDLKTFKKEYKITD